MIGPNKLKEKLGRGQPIFGPMMNFSSVWFIDIAGLAGFDFVMLDAEHGPLCPKSAEPLIRASEAAGMSALVRVSKNDPQEMLQYLDLGIMGVQVPHIGTGDEARRAAAALRYPPHGSRGFAATTRAAGYGFALDPKSYASLVNSELILFAMVETSDAADNIDAIVAATGVDVIAIGPSDIAASMGLTGEPGAPAVTKAVDHIIARTRAAGKWASLPATDADSAQRCIARGASIVFLSPAAFLVNAWRKFVQDVRP